MKIITDRIPIGELKKMAEAGFGDMVKAVVDVAKKSIAVEAELHADLEAALLETGSAQEDLWGINFYPDLPGEQMVEFDSMINLRPSQGNRSRGIESEVIRSQILSIVKEKVVP